MPDATLRDWLRRATQVLSDAGVGSPRPDAERLAAHGLGIAWSELWLRLDDPVQVAPLDALIERRASHEPLAYITGSVVFWGLEMACGPGALVPRPETETLVDVALELTSGSQRAVDVGTGTGAVAVAFARERPGAEVWATDISPDALRWADRNVARHAPGVRLVPGDLLGPVPRRLRGSIDLVMSNPPYVPEGRSDLLGPDVLREPAQALFAGPDGDEVLVRLVGEAGEALASDGVLALEVGTPEQAERVRTLVAGWKASGVRDDHTGRPRVVWARGPR